MIQPMKKKDIQTILIVLRALALCCAGCARNGYGCNGRGKIMTRVAGMDFKQYKKHLEGEGYRADIATHMAKVDFKIIPLDSLYIAIMED